MRCMASHAGTCVIIRRLRTQEPLDGCHMLFISASERKQMAQILGAVGRAPIVTISEVPRFTGQGGMINFVLEKDKVRFEINPDTAEASGIRISANLLKLARIDRTRAKEG